MGSAVGIWKLQPTSGVASSFAQYVAKFIARPLNLTRTSVHMPPPAAGLQLAECFTAAGAPVPHQYGELGK